MTFEFPHDEYSIYTTDDRLKPRYVTLGLDVLDEAVTLLSTNLNPQWRHVHRKEVAENVYLTADTDPKDYENAVRLESVGYEGWMHVRDGDFEERVSFDTMLFHLADDPWREETEVDPYEFVEDRHHDEMESAWEAYREETE